MLLSLRSRQGVEYGDDIAPQAIDLVSHRSAGLFRAPAFGRRRAILSWLNAANLTDAVSAGLPAARPDAALRQAVEALRSARVGGTPGLPDPGAQELGHGHGAAVLVVDPCDPALAGAAARMLEAAR